MLNSAETLVLQALRQGLPLVKDSYGVLAETVV